MKITDLPTKYQKQAEGKYKHELGIKYQETDKTSQKSKYGAIKITINNIRFDSKKEAERYKYLKIMLDKGLITNLKLQETFTLQNAYTTSEGKRIRAITYKADFTYVQDEKKIVEDVKGMRTDIYKLKNKLMQEKFNITISEV